jgi:hypothetical protein
MVKFAYYAHRFTLSADSNYFYKAFTDSLRVSNAPPEIAVNNLNTV